MLKYTIQSLLRQLQAKNNPGCQQIQNMMNMGQNPEPYIKQMFGNMNEQQKQAFFKQAQRIWCTESIIK